MANPTPKAAAQSFDPFTQTVNLKIPGSPPEPIGITDIDAYFGYAMRIAINYSSQVGASLALLVVLLLLTRKEKRNSIIFIFNIIALALNGIRNILQILYFTGPFYEFYAYFAEDYSHVPANEFRISIAGDVLTFLLVCCLEASLVLQVKAVCVTMRDTHKYMLLVLSSLVALAAVVGRLALTVQNSKAIMALNNFQSQEWLAAMSLDITVASICFFSAVFVTKLGVAIYERHKIGMKRWSAMHILFIMGGQTLIIPAIFAVLQYASPVPELGSQVLTMVAIFLPLSAMWASATVENQGSTPSKPSMSLRRKLLGSNLFSTTTSGRRSPDGSKRYDSFSNGTAKSSAQISHSPNTPTQTNPFTDLEKNADREGLGVYMGKSVTVMKEAGR
ncbi:MAG: hypothetical protein M1828_007516 [Chrysothrix sp. TS-e1954]|nr:MAG: hypothetical protein M1828_007516 [Chrysothrix sp. TS-e1954]